MQHTIHPVHITHAQQAVAKYKGDVPFAAHLKSYFKQHKNSGSRDRKIVGELCYNYFRKAIFAELSPNDIPVAETTGNGYGHAKKFDGLWGAIHPSYFEKLLQKASFWIRVPRQYENLIPLLSDVILHRLEVGNAHALELNSDTKLEKLLEGHEGKYRIQDLSSQRIVEQLPELPAEAKIWDCCSGAGGKSLLLNEKYPKARLFVSDVRNSIIENLKDRFKAERKNIPSNGIIDLSKTHDYLPFKENIPTSYFDLILADVPCSGSGTWRRTPESFAISSGAEIENYVKLQRAIIENSLRFLKKGGVLVYATCSAFKKENEDNVDYFTKHLPLVPEQSYYLEDSDVLYRAVFRKK